ncbi:hypothetical protein TNCV_4866051 [Trichonephila clavipes]|nr:hypothetical protein TNCV_4866051 [Trichonephila clavipes]
MFTIFLAQFNVEVESAPLNLQMELKELQPSFELPEQQTLKDSTHSASRDEERVTPKEFHEMANLALFPKIGSQSMGRTGGI